MGLLHRNWWNMKRLGQCFCIADQKLRDAVPVLPCRYNLLLINKKLTNDEIMQDVNKPIIVADYELILPKEKLKNLETNEHSDE